MNFMLTAFLSLYLFLGFVDAANSCIKCSSCSPTYVSNSTTDVATACTSGSDTCLKMVFALPGATQIQKMCVASSSCTSTNSYFIFGFGFSVSCCSTDNCNSASHLTSFKAWKSYWLFYALLIYVTITQLAS